MRSKQNESRKHISVTDNVSPKVEEHLWGALLTRLPMVALSALIAVIVLVETSPISGQESSRRIVGASAPNAAGEVIRDEPLSRITRTLYMHSPREGQSYVINNFYVGHAGLDRYQVRTTQVQGDVYQDAKIRFSSDNGRTWSEFRKDVEQDITVKEGYAREPSIFPPVYDPVAKRMLRMTLLRTHKGDPRISGHKQLWDKSIWQSSGDDGRTWDPPKLLKYEEGADYSATDWSNPEFLTHNRSYTGYNIQPLADGGMATACSIGTTIVNEKGEKENVGGVVLFIGHWNAAQRTYQWQASNTVAVSKAISSRGLFEGWVSQLANGDLFVDMRASRTKKNPGRGFYAISKDGGKTLGKAMELKYDDDTRFFRPSSLGKMLRHSVTGKLYWFGNINDFPDLSDGNRPRYPLYFAEVDEDKPALKRHTLSVIDDYDPKTQTASIQFSNFSVVEDRETHVFELYLTGWGEYKNGRTAHVYRYAIPLKD